MIIFIIVYCIALITICISLDNEKENKKNSIKRIRGLQNKMKTKEKSITIRIEKELHQKLTHQSEIDNISLGELCRNLLNGGLMYENNKHNKKRRQGDF